MANVNFLGFSVSFMKEHSTDYERVGSIKCNDEIIGFFLVRNCGDVSKVVVSAVSEDAFVRLCCGSVCYHMTKHGDNYTDMRTVDYIKAFVGDLIKRLD